MAEDSFGVTIWERGERTPWAGQSQIGSQGSGKVAGSFQTPGKPPSRRRPPRKWGWGSHSPSHPPKDNPKGPRGRGGGGEGGESRAGVQSERTRRSKWNLASKRGHRASGQERTERERRAGIGEPGTTLPWPQSSSEGEPARSPSSRPKPSGSWHSRWLAGGRVWLGDEGRAVGCASPRGESQRTWCGERVETGLLWSSLAAAGGASGNHVRVTPTPPLPAPEWRGTGGGGWRRSRASGGSCSHPHPNSPTPDPAWGGGPGEVRAWARDQADFRAPALRPRPNPAFPQTPSNLARDGSSSDRLCRLPLEPQPARVGGT